MQSRCPSWLLEQPRHLTGVTARSLAVLQSPASRARSAPPESHLLLSEVTAPAARRGGLTASAAGKLCGAALGCSMKTAPRLLLCPHGSIPTAPFRLHSLVLGDLPLLL